MSSICSNPFTTLEINGNGDAFTCCMPYINNYSIGNLFDSNIQSVNDIWYSEKATVLRQKILNGDYSMCNLDLCRERFATRGNNFSAVPDLPVYVKFCYDRECNINCITCRDNIYHNSENLKRELDAKIDTILMPLLKNAQILAIDGAGEAFFSSHSRNLLKKIASEYPILQFDINTNGILFNENNCRQLGVLGRINEVFISFPAIDKDIFNYIMKGSNYDVVVNNIKWASKAQKEGLIKKVTLNVVVHSINFREIPKLIKFARELDVYVTFSQFCYWGTEFGKDYNSIAVWEKEHKDFKEFEKILKENANNYDKIFMQGLFQNIVTRGERK